MQNTTMQELNEKEKKAIWFIRVMYWVGIGTTIFWAVKLLVLVSTYDFCPLYYGISCLPK